MRYGLSVEGNTETAVTGGEGGKFGVERREAIGRTDRGNGRKYNRVNISVDALKSGRGDSLREVS